MSAEHVFPDWSQPFLDSDAGPGTHTRTILRATGETTTEHRGLPATATVRSVCESCNNGWMSALEANAKPYLVSMLRDHRRTYYSGGRKLLATWAVKTAVVAGSKFTPETPETFYRDLHKNGAPSETTCVWLGATPWTNFHYVDCRPLKVSRDAEPPVRSENAFAGLLALGTIVFYVVSWLENVPNVEPVEKYSDSLLAIWPYSGPKTWPPAGRRFDLAGLDELANTFGSAPAHP